ncbi:MAG: NPCBM/NEW2 domain-containing protein, partial [Phycisphaerales bacterium]|nr:NPCBM/NEW2 domain-containing protein [Phycisphaerales bacterium]
VSPLITRTTPGRSTTINVDLGGQPRLFLLVDHGDGPGPDPDVFDYDWADWANMELSGPGVPTIPLTSLNWVTATSGWTGPEIDRNCENSGPLRINGTTYASGIGTHARSIIEYALPAGYTTLTGIGGLDDGGANQNNSTSSVRFAVTTRGSSNHPSVDVDLASLGITGAVEVRDLWNRTNIGTVQGTFSPEVAPRSAGLYLLGACIFDLDGDGTADEADVLRLIEMLEGGG